MNSSRADHFGNTASDYDAPTAGDQADFFADRDDYERGWHPVQPTPAELARWTR